MKIVGAVLLASLLSGCGPSGSAVEEARQGQETEKRVQQQLDDAARVDAQRRDAAEKAAQ